MVDHLAHTVARPRSLARIQQWLTPHRRRQIGRYLVSYSMISPFYIIFMVFGFIPLLFSLYLSFHSWNMLTPMTFVGLNNYRRLLTVDPLFWPAVYNTLYIGIAASLAVVGGSLVLGFILDSSNVKFRHFFRSVYFLPVLVSSVAVAIVFSQLFATQYGMVNAVLTALDLPRIGWLTGGGEWFKAVIIVLAIWRRLGWNIILVTAGLQSIPIELYEAARVDGASQRDIFTKITLPLLRPIILFVLVTMINALIQLFDEPFVMSGEHLGGPNGQGLTLGIHMYSHAFLNLRLGYASAIGYVMAVVVLALSLLTIKRYGSSNT